MKLYSTSNMNWPRVMVVAFLFIFTTVLAIYKEEAKHIVKLALESNFIPISIWIYVIVAVISKSLFLDRGQSPHFKTYTEAIFSISGYGLAGTTSITLQKGAYLQFFYNAQYFYNFDSLDLASVFLVSSYLLIYTGIETTKMLTDVLYRVNGTRAESTDSLI